MVQNRHKDADIPAPFVLALDVGTTSTRALLFDMAGNAVPGIVSQIKYELTTAYDGEVSVDADKLLEAVARTIDEVLTLAGTLAQHIKAVATDTFWHSLIGIDKDGRPITPVITWEDTRSHQAALELRSLLDERTIHERTGARFHASYWPAKLRWLATEQPDISARAAQWISFGEYMHRQFLGHAVCSLSMASATGLLRMHQQQWDIELSGILRVQPKQLPELGDIRDGIQGLVLQYSGRWPALRDAIWFPALGDGAMANIGSGCASRDIWALTVGTSSAMRVVVPCGEVVPPAGLWLYLVDAKRAILGGALSEGGNMLAWLTGMLKLSGLDVIDSMVAGLQPDSHGLTVLPFVAGERSLGWHSAAHMTISGISLHTSQAMVLRAGLEALSYQILAVYECLLQTLQLSHVPRIIASGGTLLNSTTLKHIIADTLGAAIYPSRAHEASARGAALLALEALGLISDVANVSPPLEQPTQPDSRNGATYRQAAQRQHALYHLLLDSHL